jgi:hypothetical protein
MRRSKTTRKGSYTPAVAGKPATPSKVTNQGKIIPGQAAIAPTPGVSESETTYTSVNMPKPGIPGGVMASAVLLLGVGLIIATGYTNKSGANVWDFLFNPKSTTTKAQLAQPMSMLLLVIIMAVLSDMSNAIGGISILALTGFWVVWSVENPSALGNVISAISFKSTPATTTATPSGIANATPSTPTTTTGGIGSNV